MSKSGDPPVIAASLSAFIPQVGASSQEIGSHPEGQERDRDQQAR